MSRARQGTVGTQIVTTDRFLLRVCLSKEQDFCIGMNLDVSYKISAAYMIHSVNMTLI